ncbi:hypothetical protein ACIQXD_22900 [Streptomyces uncialis]|uniref:hypothetical protein n=1 Tax=Streptomyces uncialis TaxID=1048205 RepID=UPI0038241E3F
MGQGSAGLVARLTSGEAADDRDEGVGGGCLEVVRSLTGGYGLVKREELRCMR